MEETKQEKNDLQLEVEIETDEIEEQEAQIETEVERAKKKRREAIFELGLFLVLGILIGITLKTEAVKKITMGFNDYQIQKVSQSYDVSALKKKMEDELAEQQAQQEAAIQSAQQAQIEKKEQIQK